MTSAGKKPQCVRNSPPVKKTAQCTWGRRKQKQREVATERSRDRLRYAQAPTCQHTISAPDTHTFLRSGARTSHWAGRLIDLEALNHCKTGCAREMGIFLAPHGPRQGHLSGSMSHDCPECSSCRRHSMVATVKSVPKRKSRCRFRWRFSHTPQKSALNYLIIY
jgi:hypothetical protein